MVDGKIHDRAELAELLSQHAAPVASYTYRFASPDELEKAKAVLESANDKCLTRLQGDRVLSVTVPPSIKVGNDPVDLRRLVFALSAARAVSEVGLEGEMEICCGDSGGCCAN